MSCTYKLGLKRRSRDSMYSLSFVDESVLHILVPQDSEYKAEEIISSTAVAGHEEPNDSNLFPFISQRNTLHFDELVPIFVVLRTPYYEEQELKFLLSRLAIVVEAHAISSFKPSNVQDANHSPSQSRDIIWSTTVDTAEEPLVIIQQKENQTANPQVLVIWKLISFLNRPRIRLQAPTIIFKPSAVLLPAKTTTHDLSNDPNMPSGVPASVNLLESLKYDPLLRGTQPRLSAWRLLPIGSTSKETASGDESLRAISQRAFRATPALTARVRYAKCSTFIGKPTVFASLDIEPAPFSDHNMIITAIRMRLFEGSALDLSSAHALKFPITCRPKDNPVFIFHLVPNRGLDDTQNPDSASRTLEISIEANILVSQKCSPRIEMHWKTSVDFSIALNPSYGAPGQPLQRKQRPASLPVTAAASSQNEVPSIALEVNSDTSVPDLGRQRITSSSGFGMNITFTAPSTVRVGEPFCWDIFVVNRSNKSRRLAITVIPKRKRGDFKGHLTRTSSSSIGGRKDTGFADHVLDENLLYAIQKNAAKEAPQLVSLSTDVKIGPLIPGSCLNADLKFLPLAKGVLYIEAVRITDVMSNESIDVRDLPDIVAAEWAVDGLSSP